MNRFKTTSKGYKYDLFIVYGVILLLCCLTFYVFYINDFNFNKHIFFECKQDYCYNPASLYTSNIKNYCWEEWCYQEYLPRGSYGSKPMMAWVWNYIYLIAIGSVGIIFVLNHLIHNLGKPFHYEFMPDKSLVWLGKKMDQMGVGQEDERDNNNKPDR